MYHFCLQGAVKDGSAPDGTSYVDAAEKEEIKQLLKWDTTIMWSCNHLGFVEIIMLFMMEKPSVSVSKIISYDDI
jgi:hypothetical protein